VRELENAMHRAFFAADGTPPDAAPAAADSGTSEFSGGLRVARNQLVREFEARYLVWLMGETHGNVSAAARRALTARRQLGRLLRRYGIDRARFREV